MSYIKLPNDPVIPKKRGKQNRTKRQNPNQLVFNKNFRGIIRRNTNPPRTNPNPPRYVGVCRLENREYWISGWLDQTGKVIKLIFQDKEPPGSPGESPYQSSVDDQEFKLDMNDVPF